MKSKLAPLTSSSHCRRRRGHRDHHRRTDRRFGRHRHCRARTATGSMGVDWRPLGLESRPKDLGAWLLDEAASPHGAVGAPGRWQHRSSGWVWTQGHWR